MHNCQEGVIQSPAIVCKKCGLEKTTSEYRVRTDRGTIRKTCLDCEKTAKQQNYQLNRDKRLKAQLESQRINNAAYVQYQRTRRAVLAGKLPADAWGPGSWEKLAVAPRPRRTLDEDKVKAQIKAWARAHKDSRVASKQKRRAALSGGEFSADEWLSLKQLYNHQCLSCGEREPSIVLSADHVVPLSKGGSGFIENIQPLCVTCNCRKATKTIDYRVDTQLRQVSRAA